MNGQSPQIRTIVSALNFFAALKYLSNTSFSLPEKIFTCFLSLSLNSLFFLFLGTAKTILSKYFDFSNLLISNSINVLLLIF